MQYIIDHAEEIGKLLKVKAQVSEVKSIMLENLDKVFSFIICIWCLKGNINVMPEWHNCDCAFA